MFSQFAPADSLWNSCPDPIKTSHVSPNHGTKWELFLEFHLFLESSPILMSRCIPLPRPIFLSNPDDIHRRPPDASPAVPSAYLPPSWCRLSRRQERQRAGYERLAATSREGGAWDQRCDCCALRVNNAMSISSLNFSLKQLNLSFLFHACRCATPVSDPTSTPQPCQTGLCLRSCRQRQAERPLQSWPTRQYLRMLTAACSTSPG
jgi:hypothetical protein